MAALSTTSPDASGISMLPGDSAAALQQAGEGARVLHDWLAFVADRVWPPLQNALPLTLEIWLLSVGLGALLAVLLMMLAQTPLRVLVRAYVFVFRGTPLLIQLFFIYYGLATLPALRESTLLWPYFRDPFFCGVLSLTLCTAAYQVEIFRGALRAVPHGQIEAARACGMSRGLLVRRILFPIALRAALPAYANELVSMVKATALVSLIALWDVMSVALKIRNETYVTYTPLLVAGFIYLVINAVIELVFALLERRLMRHTRSPASD